MFEDIMTKDFPQIERHKTIDLLVTTNPKQGKNQENHTWAHHSKAAKKHMKNNLKISQISKRYLHSRVAALFTTVKIRE